MVDLNPKKVKEQRLIFAGTPEFARVSLQALLADDQHIVAVYTQPDRAAGRGRKLTPSPVKQLAQDHNLPVYQPLNLRDQSEQDRMSALQPDVIVVVAYGLILPQAVLDIPRLDCVNVHASLLPRWRGAAPIERVLLAGDEKTGVSIMQMAAGLDTGAVFHKVECPIESNDTAGSLHDRLAQVGVRALLQTLSELQNGTASAVPQDESLACYAAKLSKQEGLLDWQGRAVDLEHQVRAFDPWPIAYTHIGEKTLRVFAASVVEEICDQAPATIIHVNRQGIDVATGAGVLRLQKLQFPGGKVLVVADVLNAHQKDFAVGTKLGAQPL